MAANDGSVLEREKQVLADRLDPVEPPPVDPFGDSEERRPRMRRARLDDLSLENPKRLGRAVDGVTLGHDGYERSTARLGPAMKPASRRSGMISVSPTGSLSKRSTARRLCPLPRT